jgi:hypothetical protein
MHSGMPLIVAFRVNRSHNPDSKTTTSHPPLLVALLEVEWDSIKPVFPRDMEDVILSMYLPRVMPLSHPNSSLITAWTTSTIPSSLLQTRLLFLPTRNTIEMPQKLIPAGVSVSIRALYRVRTLTYFLRRWWCWCHSGCQWLSSRPRPSPGTTSELGTIPCGLWRSSRQNAFIQSAQHVAQYDGC